MQHASDVLEIAPSPLPHANSGHNLGRSGMEKLQVIYFWSNVIPLSRFQFSFTNSNFVQQFALHQNHIHFWWLRKLLEGRKGKADARVEHFSLILRTLALILQIFRSHHIHSTDGTTSHPVITTTNRCVTAIIHPYTVYRFFFFF